MENKEFIQLLQELNTAIQHSIELSAVAAKKMAEVLPRLEKMLK